VIPTIIKTDVAAISNQIKPTAPVTPVTAILDSQTSPAEFIQGQKYQALVESRLLNGDSRVLVAGRSLQIRLPENFQPGNKLQLVFISNEPKLEFLALSDTPSDNETNNTSISTTGRFLGALMQNILKQEAPANAPDTPATQSLSSAAPILTSAPINSTDLPSLLQKAIVQSGLFYESHQAQWVNGENTLENLQQEPQGKLMLVTADLSTAKVAVTASLSPEMPVHTQAIPLVQQQLTTLETGHLLWRGEVWQGQSMEWDIHEQPADEKAQENELDQAAQWRTQLRLSMPQLGDITANIALSANGISIKLNAAQLETAGLLKGNQLPLATGMQSAGLNIRAVEVEYDGG